MIRKAIARRYAIALFSAGEKEGKVRLYLEEMERFLEILEREESLKRTIFFPLFEMERRKEILKDIAKVLNLSFAFQNLLYILLERNRVSLLPEIKEEYVNLLDEKEGRVKATIFSAFPLEEEERKEMESLLKERFGKDVVLELKEDKSLIGGIKLKVKDLIIDGSIKRQIELLKENLLKG